MKMFRRVNYIFLHDEDETVPLSDYIWFYGFHGGALIVAAIFLTKLLTL